ncbi:hypothetical protein [Pyrobaculum sp.]|uniref:hypothetical protein n=1 Tax=Pyrobaculum sp. TaxID=2004705 RepID=UPI00317BDE55
MAEYRARKEWLGWGGLSPTLAEALYELADRREVRLERKIRNIYHGIGAEYHYYAVAFRVIMCQWGTEKSSFLKIFL